MKDSTDHVFLFGDLAQAFCVSKGAEFVDANYFYSEPRLKQLMKAKERDGADLNFPETKEEAGDRKYGTVGCVALDKQGNLASATSTGGVTNKKYGRIGDSPVIGAGTYADNKTCAISCTGHGEYFIFLFLMKHYGSG